MRLYYRIMSGPNTQKRKRPPNGQPSVSFGNLVKVRPFYKHAPYSSNTNNNESNNEPNYIEPIQPGHSMAELPVNLRQYNIRSQIAIQRGKERQLVKNMHILNNTLPELMINSELSNINSNIVSLVNDTKSKLYNILIKHPSRKTNTDICLNHYTNLKVNDIILNINSYIVQSLVNYMKNTNVISSLKTQPQYHTQITNIDNIIEGLVHKIYQTLYKTIIDTYTKQGLNQTTIQDELNMLINNTTNTINHIQTHIKNLLFIELANYYTEGMKRCSIDTIQDTLRKQTAVQKGGKKRAFARKFTRKNRK